MTRALADRRSPRQMVYWLWMLVVGMASAIAVFVIANAFQPPGRAVGRGQLGQDFLAFYSAGRLVDSGNAASLYDLNALAAVQRSIAAESHLTLVSDVAPWWNPPFAALLFAPLALLPFNAALVAWTVLNIAAIATAGWLLTDVIRLTSERRRDWLIVPGLLAVAAPTIQSLGHGQNTGLSLLLMTLCILAWRDRRPLLAGMTWSLLCYKPQLAGIIGVAMFATLGLRFAIGALLSGVPLLLITVRTMPGVIDEFLLRVPANMEMFQRSHPPLWTRHITVEGFLRSLPAMDANVHVQLLIKGLSFFAIAFFAAVLIRAWWRQRERSEDVAVSELRLDRFISLVILSTPLMAPYFVDYDLLLLAIPAVLIAREMMLAPDQSPAARLLRVLGPITFVWLAINPPLAGATGISLTVPLLISVAMLQARRCARMPQVATSESTTQAFTEREFVARVAA